MTRQALARWAAVVAGCAAVSAVGLLVQPPAAATAPAQRVRAADLPLTCPAGAEIAHRVSADFDHDGRRDLALAAHCRAGGGTPPDAVYLYRGATRPTVLLDAAERLTVRGLAVTPDGQIRAELVGYSSPDQPRSSPDLGGTVRWHWKSGHWAPEGDKPSGGSIHAV